MEKRIFKVKTDDKGKRLDLYLAKYNNDFSRSAIKKVIEANEVYVNGEEEYRANYKVRVGDKIEFTIANEAFENNVIPQNIPLDIIYEDENLIVVNKHTGMVVHPGSGHKKDTLVNALLYYYKDFDKFEDKIRTGLVHRIDKATSGIILAAKNNEALNYYTKQFAKRNVRKKYICVCYGELDNRLKRQRKLTVQNYLARSSKDRKKYTVVKDGGKFAHSEFEFVKSNNSQHLIIADIKTGRTHQIRVHLSSLGMPILGDKKYGSRSYKRLMLHAWKLKIKLMNGKEREFEAQIPSEFEEIFIS